MDMCFWFKIFRTNVSTLLHLARVKHIHVQLCCRNEIFSSKHNVCVRSSDYYAHITQKMCLIGICVWRWCYALRVYEWDSIIMQSYIRRNDKTLLIFQRLVYVMTKWYEKSLLFRFSRHSVSNPPPPLLFKPPFA